MPRLRKQSDTSDDAFFAALAAGKTVVEAAKLTGCSRQALYRRRIGDRAFDRRWRSIEDARKRPSRRLPRGCRRPVFDQPGGYSNGMLLGRLKTLRPERYREPRG
jgi:hypothetical protein